MTIILISTDLPTGRQEGEILKSDLEDSSSTQMGFGMTEKYLGTI